MNLQEIREKQILFEDNLVGTDKSLAEHNTPELALRRGVIGEAMEALEALDEHGEMSNEFRNEIVDVYIFFATLLNHIGMSNEELEQRAGNKVFSNFVKYRPDVIKDYPIAEGMTQCRDDFSH